MRRKEKLIYRPGAVGALLDEYERAFVDLFKVLSDVSDDELIKIIDHQTMDEECRSIQMILAHVVSSAYSYAIYIQSLNRARSERPEVRLCFSGGAYVTSLKKAFIFTVDVFEEIKDSELERFDAGDKIMTGWGQLYDIEQLMEHAIVHILRHRRQIERFVSIARTHGGISS
ncbi:DinB family protein [Pedobacter sp. PAMC26386]|nr:DinB family protein [Pedobacter sp. PAMC26386]